MRNALNIALVIVGISASVMASPRLPASPNGNSNMAEIPRYYADSSRGTAPKNCNSYWRAAIWTH